MTTPSGTPASASSAAIASAVSGVSPAGLSTTGQPAARAGPILRVAIAAGKFHGVISSADADRLAQGQDPVGAGRRPHQGALDPHRLLGVPAEELGRVGRLAARVAQRLAVLRRHQPGELLAALRHQLERLAQHLGPLPRRGRGPAGQRVVRRRSPRRARRSPCRRRPPPAAPRSPGQAPGTWRPPCPTTSDEQPGRYVESGELGDSHALLLALKTVLAARCTSVRGARPLTPTVRSDDHETAAGRAAVPGGALPGWRSSCTAAWPRSASRTRSTRWTRSPAALTAAECPGSHAGERLADQPEGGGPLLVAAALERASGGAGAARAAKLEATVTTRPVTCGSSRLVRAKWPRCDFGRADAAAAPRAASRTARTTRAPWRERPSPSPGRCRCSRR